MLRGGRKRSRFLCPGSSGANLRKGRAAQMSLQQGSNNLNPQSGGPERRRRSDRNRTAPKGTLGGVKLWKIAAAAGFGVMLIVSLFSIVTKWMVPNAMEKKALDDTRALVGATLEPGETVAAVLPAETPEPAVIILSTAVPPEETALPQGTDASAPPAAGPNVTARVTFNGLTYSPELLEDYVALYARNRDMGGWLRVRAIRNIDFAYVRGRNDYYISHDFYGNENVNGTAFLDETCTDWPRDKNLLIYAHNLRSGEMFGELHRLESLQLIRSSPFVDCDTLYEKGVYIPVAVLICAVDSSEEDYFDFNVSTFRNEAEFDAYIARCRELNRVDLDVDVQFSDDLLTLVTCCDDTGVRRFLVVCRRLRADETERSVLDRYFR